MSPAEQSLAYEKILYRYSSALERGDFELVIRDELQQEIQRTFEDCGLDFVGLHCAHHRIGEPVFGRAFRSASVNAAQSSPEILSGRRVW